MSRWKKNSQSPVKAKEESRFRTVSFLVISFLLHMFLLIGFTVYNKMFPDEIVATKEKEPDVQFIDLSQMDTAQLVEQAENEKATAKPKQANYASKVDKSVEKETIAPHKGDFQNKDSRQAQAAQSEQFSQPPPAASAANESPPTGTSASEDTIKTYDSGDFAISQHAPKKVKKAHTISDLRPNTMNEMAESMASVSQTQDRLKDVVIGAETHLNTREFLYYSYFNRIKKKLRQHWEPLIFAKVRSLAKQGRFLASSGDKDTRVVLVLDDTGLIRKVQVITTSGVGDIDEAAVDALNEAAQFPNPPKDLIRDGFVTLTWNFILET